MNAPPALPDELRRWLDRFGLVDPRRLRRAARWVAWGSRHAPPLDALWIASLERESILTPLQGAAWNDCRPEMPFVGEYILDEELHAEASYSVYRAHERGSNESIRLVLGLGMEVTPASLEASGPWIFPQAVGRDRQRYWSIYPWWPESTLAARWISRGRLPSAECLAVIGALAAGCQRAMQPGLPPIDWSFDLLWYDEPHGLRVLVLPAREGTTLEMSLPRRWGETAWFLATGRRFPPRSRDPATLAARLEVDAPLLTPAQIDALATALTAERIEWPSEPNVVPEATQGEPTFWSGREIAAVVRSWRWSSTWWDHTTATGWIRWGLVASCLILLGMIVSFKLLELPPSPAVVPVRVHLAAKETSAPPSPRFDPAVRPATFVASSADRVESRPILELHGDCPAESLELRAGMIVRGASADRPRITLPAEGWELSVEGVRFEGLDFVAAADARAVAQPWLLVRVNRATWIDCTFQGRGEADRRAAIGWNQSPAARQGVLGQLRFEGVSWRELGAGVVLLEPASGVIVVENALFLGSGPWLRFERYPRLDQAWVVNLDRLTLRGSGPLVELAEGGVTDTPGQFALTLEHCVLAPRAGEGLLSGPDSSALRRVIEGCVWQGEGTLVATETPLVTGPSGMAGFESLLRASGMTRGAITFRGPLDEGWPASCLLPGTGPAGGAVPPGIFDPRDDTTPTRGPKP